MTQFPVQNGVAIIPQGTTIINDYAFFGCQDLTTVVIPEGVTTIGGSAFRECSQLSHVVFPSTINHIGDLAFFETLWDNNLPDEELYIGTALYKTAYDIRSANVKEGTTCICSTAFGCHLNLISVTLPNTIKYIGGCAFAGCRELKSVNVPAGAVIGQGAFMGCDALEESIYPTICIGDLEFRLFHENMTATVLHCSKEATSVIIPEEVTVGPAVFIVRSIANGAFHKCTSLISVTIPDCIKRIGSNAFTACSALTSASIPGSAQDMGHHIFYLCTALKSVEIREGIKKLECAIFRDCQSLENISYSGTMEQWQQIELDYYWNWNVPAKQVRCSNGNVNIEKSPK